MTKRLIFGSFISILITIFLSGCGEDLKGETPGHIGGLGSSVIKGLQALDQTEIQE